jgi:hypothetical protein
MNCKTSGFNKLLYIYLPLKQSMTPALIYKNLVLSATTIDNREIYLPIPKKC